MKYLLIAVLSLFASFANAQSTLENHNYYNTGAGPNTPPYAFIYMTYAQLAAEKNPADYAGQNALTGDNGPYYSNGTAWVQISAGGVNQILAGTNVTVSPSGGTGAVTVNASGGGSLPLQFVACTNGSTGTVDTALLTAAFAVGGNITLTGNCTVNNFFTAIQNTSFNGNGFTVTAAAASNWSGSTVQGFVKAASGANGITVQNTNFAYTGASGAYHIIEFPSSNAHVKVLNNWSTGAGDLVATIGTIDALTQGNTCLASLNSCYDHWGGATDIKDIGNTAQQVTNTGAACYQFTGFNTNGTISTTTGYTALGNTCYLTVNVQIGININGFVGSCSGGADDQIIVGDNRIYVAAGTESPGIRFSGCGNYADAHDNYGQADGTTTSSYPFIEAQSSWTGVKMHDNIAKGWLSPSTGSDDGVYNNQSPNGTITFNQCLSNCGSLLVGATATTTQVACNSFGTADCTFTNSTGSPMLIGQTTGNNGYNSAAAFLGPNTTAGDRTTVDIGHDTGTGNGIQEEFGYTGNNNGSNYWGISMLGVGTDFIKWVYFPDVLTLGDGAAIALNGTTTAGTINGVTIPAVTGTAAILNQAQTWTAVQTFTNSDLKLLGSSTGVTTFTSANATASNFTTTVPAFTGTVAELGLAETWTALQTFTNSDLALLGSSTGATTLTSANASATAFTATLPANTGTLSELNLAQSWTAIQTFTNSDLKLLGSSTGATTLTSANASATAYTLTLPANTGTVAETNLAQNFTAAQTFSGGLGGYLVSVGTQAGATCTLTSTGNAGCSSLTGGAGDCGTFIHFTSATAVTVTIPTGLAVGCQVTLEQDAAGKVSVNGAAVTAATLHSPHSYTGTSAQYALIGVSMAAASSAILSGDGS